MKLGQILIAAGKVAPEHLDEALRAQVIHGGRLGTNLVERGRIDLDTIALALARQHNLPAALTGHFDRCDGAVQTKLPPEVAQTWSVVPIGYLSTDRHRIAVAALDPLPPHAVEEIASYLGCPAVALVVSLAAELRLRYFLERCYGIERSNRFIRVRDSGGGDIPRPPPDADLDTGPIDAEIIDDDSVDVALDVDEVVEEIDDAVPVELEPASEATMRFRTPAEEVLHEEVTPGQRRRFVQTISEEAEPAKRAPSAPPTGTLGRIAIKRVAAGPDGKLYVAPPASEPAASTAPAALPTIEDAERAVRRSQTRDQVGDVVIRALHRFTQTDVAALFIVRDPVAIGWKGIVKGSEIALDSIALPLNEPCALAQAYGHGGLVLIDGSDATTLDRKMWRALELPPPTAMAAAGITVGDQVVCLLYAHAAHGAVLAQAVDRLAEAASTAFGRMLRTASR